MFSFFKKPEPPKVVETPKPPEPDYVIMVNGYGVYTIKQKAYCGYRDYWGLAFTSRELAEKHLLDYLDHQEKLRETVVSEIFIKRS